MVRLGTPMKDLSDVFSMHENSQFPSHSQISVLTWNNIKLITRLKINSPDQTLRNLNLDKE